VSSETTTDAVSTLYDQVIAASITRLAAAVEPDNEPSTCSDKYTEENLTLIIVCAILAAMFIVVLGLYYNLLQKYNAKDYKRISVSEGGEPVDLTRNEPLINDGHA
jgi:hypothetical protein